LQQISVIAPAPDDSIENRWIQQFRRTGSRRRRVISTQFDRKKPESYLKLGLSNPYDNPDEFIGFFL